MEHFETIIGNSMRCIINRLDRIMQHSIFGAQPNSRIPTQKNVSNLALFQRQCASTRLVFEYQMAAAQIITDNVCSNAHQFLYYALEMLSLYDKHMIQCQLVDY